MKKEVYIKALEKMMLAISELQKEAEKQADEAENKNYDLCAEYDEQVLAFKDMIMRLRMKIDRLNGKTLNTVDYFPDMRVDENDNIQSTPFFNYVQMMDLDIVTNKEVAQIIGWDWNKIDALFECLPTPIREGSMLTFWNKSDFKYWPHNSHYVSTLSKVVTVAEAAKMIGISEEEVLQLHKEKKIASRETEDGTVLIGKRSAEDIGKALAW